jgi:hypothetical protein
MTRWGVVAGVLCAATLVLLAGCGTTVVGAAVPNAGAARTASKPIDTESVFGDGATVDPCSVVDADHVPDVRNAELNPADALDDCALDVVQRDGTDTYVDVGPLETTADDQVPVSQLKLVRALPSGMSLRVDDTSPTPGFCDAYLVFPDAYDLLVTASASDQKSQADVCPAAEAMAENAAGRIEARTVRHDRYPAGSVGLINPCGLFTQADLTAVKLPNETAVPYPEDHECFWVSSDGDDGTWLKTEFLVGDLDVADPTTDKRVTIAGRQSVTSSYDSSGTPGCYVDTAVGPVPQGDEGQDNTGQSEIAQVDLELPDGKADVCGAATKLAATIWPKLPTTH